MKKYKPRLILQILIAMVMIGHISAAETSITKLTKSAALICSNYPQFSEGCKGLDSTIAKANNFLTKVKSKGFKNMVKLHDHCKQTKYRDIFGLCKKTNQIDADLDEKLGLVTTAIVRFG